jgi:hypothetical protein
MKLNNLLLLTLTALVASSAQAMNKSHIDTEAAAQRAQQIATSLANGQAITPAAPAASTASPVQTNAESKRAAASAQKNSAKAQAVDREKLHAALPEDVQYNIGAFFTREAWRQEFYENAVRYKIGDLGSKAKINEISTDGTNILSVVNAYEGDTTNTIKLWDIHTAACLGTIKWEQPIKATALSDNYMVIADTEMITVFDRRTNKPQYLGEVPDQDTFQCVSISSDERYLSCATAEGNIFVWQRTENGDWQKLYRLLAASSDVINVRQVNNIIFSPDNQLMATASFMSRIQVWDLATGTCRYTIHTLNSPYGVSISPQSDFIVTGACGRSTAQMFDLATGAMIREFSLGANNSDQAVWMTHISSDGTKITTGHIEGNYRIWDATTGSLIKHFEYGMGNHANFAQTTSNCPFIVLKENRWKSANIIIIRMTEEGLDKLLEQLTLQQLLLIDELIRARAPEVQKNPTAPIKLSSNQLEIFRQLPPFVQTALRINLTIDVPTLESAQSKTIDKADHKNN